jgi:hypothetical protein
MSNTEGNTTGTQHGGGDDIPSVFVSADQENNADSVVSSGHAPSISLQPPTPTNQPPIDAVSGDLPPGFDALQALAESASEAMQQHQQQQPQQHSIALNIPSTPPQGHHRQASIDLISSSPSTYGGSPSSSLRHHPYNNGSLWDSNLSDTSLSTGPGPVRTRRISSGGLSISTAGSRDSIGSLDFQLDELGLGSNNMPPAPASRRRARATKRVSYAEERDADSSGPGEEDDNDGEYAPEPLEQEEDRQLEQEFEAEADPEASLTTTRRTSHEDSETPPPAFDFRRPLKITPDDIPQQQKAEIRLTATGKPSHARKQPAGYVKRPRNAFILFRSYACVNNLIPSELGKLYC